jgi:Raf kinase inhibitor-like YbhB/YbcL family protein
MAMTLSSPAFQQNGHIPLKYTCEGEDVSPPLAWEGVPDGAKSLVLIIDDPDAPDPRAPKMVWVHWVVYNIPPDTESLPESASKTRLPQGASLGLNDFKKTGYGGPCPPVGRHRYFHKLYALNITRDLRGATKSQIERAMQGTCWPMQKSSERIKRVTRSSCQLVGPVTRLGQFDGLSCPGESRCRG